mmetsp:Transcript_54103/g.107412  ORF Transcript_54103/g.107412 Transcript_54103/m.107412 type:complete len:218 (-) Transcript_54103:59-712(-)
MSSTYGIKSRKNLTRTRQSDRGCKNETFSYRRGPLYIRRKTRRSGKYSQKIGQPLIKELVVSTFGEKPLLQHANAAHISVVFAASLFYVAQRSITAALNVFFVAPVKLFKMMLPALRTKRDIIRKTFDIFAFTYCPACQLLILVCLPLAPKRCIHDPKSKQLKDGTKQGHCVHCIDASKCRAVRAVDMNYTENEKRRRRSNQITPKNIADPSVLCTE